jgi:lysyl-tRNA synthetase class II
MSLPIVALLVGSLQAAPLYAADMADRLNDYPTEARADYVFGCMAANGQSRESLRKCSCSIDAIAEILPYEDYVTAETVLSMQQGSGERLSMFKTMAVATEAVRELRRAQAEAEMRCFE